MVYITIILFLIHTVVLCCQESVQPTPQEEYELFTHNPLSPDSTTISVENNFSPIPSPTIPHDLVSHFNFIKNFLKVAPEEFSSEYKLFEKHSILKWNGYANALIIDHARTKLAELNTPIRHTSLHITMYIDLLNNLLAYSQSHNETNKRNLRCQIITGTIGIALTVGTSLATRYIP